jgi:hypothetical protein
MYRVVQKCNRPSQKAAKNLCNHQAKRRSHGPAQDTGFHWGMRMIVPACMIARLIMNPMRVGVHR